MEIWILKKWLYMNRNEKQHRCIKPIKGKKIYFKHHKIKKWKHVWSPAEARFVDDKYI